MKILCLIFGPIGLFIGIVGIFTASELFEVVVHLVALFMGLSLLFCYYVLKQAE